MPEVAWYSVCARCAKFDLKHKTPRRLDDGTKPVEGECTEGFDIGEEPLFACYKFIDRKTGERGY